MESADVHAGLAGADSLRRLRPGDAEGEASGLQETQLTASGDGLSAAADPQLAEDVVEMLLDGADRQHERVRNLLIGFARNQKPEDFQLALAERLDEDCGWWIGDS